MKTRLMLLTATVALLGALSSAAYAKINVVTTTPDLADIARSIGGSKVSAISLARGDQDMHFVEPRPSMVNYLRKADLFVRVGMDLDIWAQGLVDAARNKKIVYGAQGYVDASTGIRKLEIPTVKLDPSMGHIHIYGNPHYWLDPANGKVIARSILAGLIRVSPGDEAYFRGNYESFANKLDKAISAWKKRLAPFDGAKVVTYHKSWAYFNNRFGLVEFGNVEPKPGIPPSPSHVNSLIKRMKGARVKVILMEPFYPRKFPQMIARETGAKLLIVPTSVGAMKGADSYFELFDHLANQVADALK
ncbi:MAG TPA: metal ABC transporter substrate-binding protein [Armatimonadota bacterium]|nr:metal ABC transporter substrate-binding protein [Armatimonadota bacterium]